MSKSLGNVVDPVDIVDGKLNYGADVFRIWVSKYANSHVNVATKHEQFALSQEILQKWRKVFRYSIANLNDFKLTDLVNYEDMNELDKYFLFKLFEYNKQMERSYEQFDLNTIFEETNNFMNDSLSSYYFPSIKNKLYNEKLDNISRRSVQTFLYYMNKVIEQNLSPIIPIFFYNFKQYHPLEEERKHLIDYFNCPEKWNNLPLKSSFELINQIKECLNEFRFNETISPEFKLILFPKDKQTRLSIENILTNQDLTHELNEILLVQSIEFDLNNQLENSFNLSELDRLQFDSEINEENEQKIGDYKDKLIKKLRDKTDKVSKYIEIDNFSLILERTKCKRCLRCRLYKCGDNQTKPICIKCKIFLKQNHPHLL